MDDTRIRFLTSIAAQLDVDRIAEAHLFPAIRQGGMESGVAVLALDLARQGEASDEVPSAESPSAELVAEPERVESESPYADSDVVDEVSEPIEPEPDEAPVRSRPRRFTVYTARYRHTLKGPDRGKWEVSVTEEADAPLMTVDAVVRGVQRRSGDVDEIVRLTGDEVVALTTVRTTAA
jgi:hypothetical protein